MSANTKTILAIVALVVVYGAVSAFLLTKNTTQQQIQPLTRKTQPPPSQIIQGTVTSVDAEKLQITITTTSAGAFEKVTPTGIEKIITIAPATKIEKIISQKNAKGEVEKQTVLEVNVSDVQKGNHVTVMYQSEKDNVLEGVSRITFVVEGNIATYVKQAAKAQIANPVAYVRGKVLSVDAAKRTVDFYLYVPDHVPDKQMTATLSVGGKVYEIDNVARVHIEHAKREISLKDIKSGDTVFFAVGMDANFSQATTTAETILLLSDKVL